MTTDKNTTTQPTTTTATSAKDPKLPQTGQLWWPIFPLTAGGLVFLVAGLIVPNRKDDDE